jgi:hypothetical protein
MRVISWCCAAALVGWAISAAPAQDTKKQAEKAASGGGEYQAVKPGPEHAILKLDEGLWEATVESYNEPGGKPEVSKGTEVNSMLSGGLWLVQDFRGSMGGQPFQGHGMTGYDPAKKKYVGSWVDSMMPSMSTIESTYDAKTKTMTGELLGSDPAGNPVKMKAVSKWNDDGTRLFTLSMTGADGKDFDMMKITYRRRQMMPGKVGGAPRSR